jgi:hypothetical protein
MYPIIAKDVSCNFQDSFKFPIKISYKDTVYDLLGYAINPYYNMNYLIYEHIISSNDKLVNDDMNFLKNDYCMYEYILVKMNDNTPYILHVISPRDKVNVGEFVHLSAGVFQLGPIKILKIK